MIGNVKKEGVKIISNRKESAVKAFDNLYGRFFAGRTITAKFYNEKSFEERNLYLPL